MRIIFTAVFTVLIAALIYCAHVARRSGKEMGIPVMRMLLALLPPIAGNLLIIASTDQTISTIGYYTYFLGMDLVMVAVVQFTLKYCNMELDKAVRNVIFFILAVDVLQIVTNPVHGMTFTTERIIAYGAPYFRLIPLAGQLFHRIVDYTIIGGVVFVFLDKLRHSNRYNSEKYVVILLTMVVTIIWQSMYIFSRTPLDRSMLGYGVFGLLVFYFSLYYRPFRLLDTMLSAVASNIPDAIYFFDLSGQCIWVNKHGLELVGMEKEDFDEAGSRFGDMVGDIGRSEGDWSDQRVIGKGENVKSYVIEHRMVKDRNGREVGYFLNVRDNTSEQKTLQHEIYNATHDALTQLYNRAGYELLIKNIKQDSVLMLLVDADDFKSINDEYGHHIGDQVLQKIASTLRSHFRDNDYICRVGGDEFVVLMSDSDMGQYDRIQKRIGLINKTLSDTSDGLPSITVSAGLAYGDKDVDIGELFDRADRALYTTKQEGKKGITIFSQDGSEGSESKGKEQGHLS